MKRKLFAVLLTVALVLTMSVSVFAVSRDASEYDVEILPAELGTFENFEGGAAPEGWTKASLADAGFKPYVDETYGNVLQVMNQSNGNGKGLYTNYSYGRETIVIDETPYEKAPKFAEVMIEFDFLNSGSNKVCMILAAEDGPYDEDTKADRQNFLTFSNKSKLLNGSETVGSYTMGEWYKVKVFVNYATGKVAVYLNNKLAAQYVNDSILSAPWHKCSAFRIEFGSDDATGEKFFLLDNVVFKGKTTTFDTSVYDVPAYYPENMNYFENFNAKYEDQNAIFDEDGNPVLVNTDNCSAGTIVADTTNWSISDSGHVLSATHHPYTANSSDKYLKVEFKTDKLAVSNNLNDNYIILKYNNGGVVFKELVPPVEGNTDPETGEQIYEDPIFKDDARFLYTTMMVGGFDSASNFVGGSNSENKYQNCFYSISRLASPSENGSELSNTAWYINYDGFATTPSATAFLDITGEKDDKMYRIDTIYDFANGMYYLYIDGSLIRKSNKEAEKILSPSNAKSVMMKQVKIGSRFASGLYLDNVGYKIYGRYSEGENPSEITIDDVLADIFTPHINTCEILTTSTNKNLDFLARVSGVDSDGVAGYVSIVAMDETNKITNIKFGPVDGKQFKTSFTNDLENTDKIVVYYFGDNMDYVTKPIVVPYDVTEYPDPEPEEEPAE